MTRAAVSRALLTVLVFGACGVAEVTMQQPPRSRAHVDSRPPDALEGLPRLAWAREVPKAIVVDRRAKAVVLYEYGVPRRIFDAVFGRVPGRKLYQGDRRTPAGVYRITGKRAHYKFHKFLDIDYPNRDDVRRYEEALARGEIPPGTEGPGGLVGIHGSDDERLNDFDVDWTLGCVSLKNSDMDVLYESVEEGTPVVITEPRSRASRSSEGSSAVSSRVSSRAARD